MDNLQTKIKEARVSIFSTTLVKTTRNVVSITQKVIESQHIYICYVILSLHILINTTQNVKNVFFLFLTFFDFENHTILYG